MNEMFTEYKDQADFLCIYIREAHPADSNFHMETFIDYDEPKTIEERKMAV